MYNKHEYSPTKVLDAQDLNEMEQQIIINDGHLEQASEDAEDLDGESTDTIKGISLTTDSNGISLSFGGNIIATAAYPADYDDYVAATSLSVMPAEVGLVEGEQAALTTSVLPANTSLALGFISHDRSIAKVRRNGTVQGICLGKTDITAFCGNQSQTIPVSVDRLGNPISVVLGGAATYDTEEHALWFLNSYSIRAWITPDSGFTIPPGCTATFSLNDLVDEGYRIRYAVFVKPETPGNVPHVITSSIGAKGVMDIIRVAEFDITDYTEQAEDFVYTNTTEDTLYPLIAYMTSGSWTDQEVLDMFMEGMTCRVSITEE